MNIFIPKAASSVVSEPIMQEQKSQAAAPETPVFTMLGQSDNVCVDGVCAVPQAPSDI